MKIQKTATKRNIKETKNGVIITESEERTIEITPEELVNLKNSWENRIAQIDNNTSEVFLVNIREEMNLLKEVLECLKPVIQKGDSVKNTPANVEYVHKSLKELVSAYQLRIDQIQRMLSEEYVAEQKNLREELEKGIQEIKPITDKIMLGKKAEEKMSERKKR